MQAKALEIRDEGTFIACLAVDMNPRAPAIGADDGGAEAQRWLLRRCGYPCNGRPNVIVTRLDGDGRATNDPHAQEGRTWPVAHFYIIEHWAELADGDVVDVSFILGETPKPKVSERFKSPL